MLNQVYPECPQIKKYNNTKTGFLDSLSRLKPLMRHKENEKEFYKKFTTVNVLPAIFQEDYEQKMMEFNYMEAEKLLVPIHQGLFHKLINLDIIEKKQFNIQKNNWIKTLSYWCVHCRYSSDLGLIDYDTNNATNFIKEIKKKRIAEYVL